MERHSRARGDSADAEVHRGEASAVEAPDFFLFAEEEPPRKKPHKHKEYDALFPATRSYATHDGR